MATIPRIVLDDRAVDGGSDPVSSSSPSSSNGPVLVMAAGAGSGAGAGGGRPLSGVEIPAAETHVYVPHRCNSDIGLPTTSMPNLSLAMGLGNNEHGGEGVDKLGVYCSPRTTRRSVDLEVGSSSRDPAERAEYEWLEDKTSSLQVLSSGSRVGSAISLNSVCTAHSVGLLSNDSDDDFQDTSVNDSSVSEGHQGSDRAAGTQQLRRLQSYPEEDHSGVNDAGVTPRTSHSLCNLQAAQARSSLVVEDRAACASKDAAAPEAELTPEKLSLLPSDVDECPERRMPPPPFSGPTERKDRREGRGGGAKPKAAGGREEGMKVPMVSYGSGSNAMREGRIRQWLEDMDKTS